MNSRLFKILKTSIQSGIFFSVSYSAFWFISNDSSVNRFIINIISAFVGWTVLCSLFLLWTNYKYSKIEKDFANQGINIIYSVMANHVLNGEAIGGNLFLAEDRIIFRSHGVSIQKSNFEILLSDIVSIEKYKVSGMFGNGLKILQNSKTDNFVIGTPTGADRKELLKVLKEKTSLICN